MMMKLDVSRARGGVLVGALAALLALAVAVANAAFSSPVNLSATNKFAEDPQIASDADGDAVAVWKRSDGSNLRIEARSISATGALGPVKTLSGPGQNAFGPQIASDADGDAVAVWSRSDGSNFRVQSRSISAAGVLGPVKTLSRAGQSAIWPQIASDAGGDAVAVWSRFDGSDWRVQARSISAAGVSGPERTLSRAGEDAEQQQIASDADGDAVAVWRRFEGPNWRVQARSISAAGVLGPDRTLSLDGASGPQIASDSDGDAVAVWWRYNGSVYRIEARSISAAGVPGPVKGLSGAGQNADLPQIASDADGDAVAVWRRSEARIEARSISAAGAIGPIETLSPIGSESRDPQIASDSDGDAVAVWSLLYPAGASRGIQAAQGP